ncbi:MAG: class I adenylate-forming enzyme family protein [Candidatus Methylomirabilia bacterium]
MRYNFGGALRFNAEQFADKPAVVTDDRSVTYEELNERVNRAIGALGKAGVRKGDKVAVLDGNTTEAVENYCAILKMGACLVPLNPLVQGRELTLMLNDSDSTALFFGKRFVPLIQAVHGELRNIPADRLICTSDEHVEGFTPYAKLIEEGSPEEPDVEIEDADLFNIMYSSGTTGTPKGIVMSHRTRTIFTLFFGVIFGIGRKSVILNSTAIYHNGSFAFMLPCLANGGTFVLMKKFDPEGWLQTVQHERVTHAYLVPTQFISILSVPTFKRYDTSSLELLLSMAAPLTKKTKIEILENFHCELFEIYGVTEGVGTLLLPHDQLRKLGSVGRSLPGTKIRIVDEQMKDVPAGEIGEICGVSDLVMEGYYRRPDLTAEAIVDGWLRTGDLGKLDEEGYLYLVDRKKDMIISGGVNVYPKDIEEVIMTHPAIREVAVFGVPSVKWGETPLATVILREGQSATEEELLSWINERVAKYQRVSRVSILADFPRNPAGKILKREMRTPYWKEQEGLI